MTDHDNQDSAAGGCRIDVFLKFLAQEWMSHIVWTLGRHEALRFGALRRALPGAISARVLSSRLKALEEHGFVSRHEIGTAVRHVEYRLTEDGRALDAVLLQNESLPALPNLLGSRSS